VNEFDLNEFDLNDFDLNLMKTKPVEERSLAGVPMKASTSSFRSLIRPLAASVLVALLAGCVSMKGLQPQGSLTAPDRLATRHSLAGVNLTPAAWPQADWWAALGDQQLDGLVQEALSGNPGLDAVDARLRIALAQAGAQDAARRPKVGAQAEYSGIYIPATLAPAPFGGNYLGAHLLTVNGSYSPDLWGGHRAAWEAAVDQAHAAQVDAQAARLTLSTGVVQAYVELSHAAEAEAIAQRELDRSHGTQKLTSQRVKAGLDSDFQLRQTDAAVATAQRGLEAAHEQAALARAALAALVGKGPDRGLDIATPHPLAAMPLQLPSDLPSDLLARRPDIVAARWRVEAAARGIAATKASFYPNVNLSVTAGLASLSLDNLFSLPSRFGQIVPAVSLPIFDGGRLRSGLAERDADYDAAVAQYDQTLVDALHEVAEQVIALHAIDTQIVSQQQAQDAAQSAYNLGMQRFHGGLSALLDVLTVQQALLRSEQQMADLHAQRLAASVKLVQALGGGYQADATTAPPGAAPDTELARRPFAHSDQPATPATH
jgi:NodT family efflux transporter outer membrane factor (OMF) lipoprotein